ncbi:hypothetical protein MVEN_00024300 [Mycena venus]|uniref:CCHC-type domain-containing protein n=1 Tax=Mycena venus TaxID=2733690 RepID=A0A8H7DHL0_9AGAR|nr:hypothetical protein MVEN_00024300 [Mycena venus]
MLTNVTLTPVRPANAITSRIATTTPGERPRPLAAGAAKPAAPSSTAQKACYTCGQFGHLAKDHINDSASTHEGPENNEYQGDDEQVDALESGNEAFNDLWGGDQYSANELLDDYPADLDAAHMDGDGTEADPHAAPELDELLDATEESEVRVGAMRQYFSLRVDPTDEDGPTRLPAVAGAVAAPNRRTLLVDTDLLMIGVSGEEYPVWSATGEARQLEDRGVGWYAVPNALLMIPPHFGVFPSLHQEFGDFPHNFYFF